MSRRRRWWSLVETGTEPASCSGQDDGSNFRIRLSFVQRLMELLEHARVIALSASGRFIVIRTPPRCFRRESLYSPSSFTPMEHWIVQGIRG